MKYRIMKARWDDHEARIETEFEAENDGAAKATFDLFKNDPRLSWETLWLLRIDQEERTSQLASCRL